MWTAALQDRRIQFGVPLLVEPPGEGGPPFKKCRFLGSALQTELLDSGWAPTKSVFNMHPRWFSGKPTFQKQDCGVEAGRWETVEVRALLWNWPRWGAQVQGHFRVSVYSARLL